MASDRIKKILSKYRSTVILNCMDKESDPTQLTYWQNYLFASTILFILPLSIIVMIPGVYMAYLHDLKILLFVDLLAFFTIIFVAFTPQIAVFKRKLLFNGVLYITSVTLLIYLGSLGPGLLYLLGITIFIVLSLDKIYAYLAVGLNILICMIMGFSIHAGYASPVIQTAYSFESWIAVSSNLILLSASAVLLIPILFDGLRASLSLEKQLYSDLEKEQQWLKLLEAAVGNTSEAIAILESDQSGKSDRKIIYVNKGFENMTGYRSEEVVGGSFNILGRSYASKQERIDLMKALDHRKPHEMEFISNKKSGDEYWVHVSLAPVQDFNDQLSHWIVVGRDVTENRNNVQELRESLVEKETLLMEIHHRVKNNLAVVSSMMQLQALEEKDAALQEKLYDSVARIRTMSTIHELLYESGNFAKVNFTKNLEKLVSMIIETIQNEQEMHVEYLCEDLELNVNQAIPCSLIVNEVVTNAIKHAFKGRQEGNITIGVEQIENNQICIRVGDDGKGLPEDFGHRESSLGMQLIKVLSEQMNASHSFTSKPNAGTIFEIHFTKTIIRGIGNAYL